jgi:hypothetical protein
MPLQLRVSETVGVWLAEPKTQREIQQHNPDRITTKKAIVPPMKNDRLSTELNQH